jgi:hypothetical protein
MEASRKANGVSFRKTGDTVPDEVKILKDF